MRYKNFYFCNLDFGKQLTGIERSALKRAQLFKKYLGVDAIFLTTKLNVELHRNFDRLKDLGLMPKTSEVYGLFEYLRGSYHSNRFVRGRQDLNIQQYNIVDVVENDAHQRWYSKNNPDFVKYVVWTDNHKTQMLYVNSLFKGRVIKREKYDLDGHLYMVQEVDSKGKTTMENLMHLDGYMFLQMYFSEDNQVEKFILFSENGLVQDVFTTEQQLVDYWLKEIMTTTEPCCFIVDRNLPWNYALRNYHKEHGHLSISIVHNSHLLELEKDLFNGRLNKHFADVIQEKYKVDHIVTLTDHQKADILKRYPTKNNLITIPHSIDILPKKVAFESRNPNKIVVMCRLAADKQVEHTVYMMQQLVVDFPKLQLYIYGDGAQKQTLINLIQELRLENNVYIVGYIDDISCVLNDAVFFLLTSRIEGFSLAILESLSFGVPAGSYNICYGPPSLIQDNSNGFIVEHGQYKVLAEKLAGVLSDPVQLKKMSENAYASVERFKEENVAEIWRGLIES